MLRRPLRVVVALSGGVDSSVAALLLTKYAPPGVEVVAAAHMTNWSAESEDVGCDVSPSSKVSPAPPATLSCGEELRAARDVAERLRLPFHHCEFEAEYYTQVFRPMVDAYAAGRTANPDCECNAVIKFGRFARHVRQRFQADVIATGHYARNQYLPLSAFLARRALGEHASNADADVAAVVEPEPALRGLVARPFAAATNDQSYFLSRVDGADIDATVFPNSELTKQQVRALAADAGFDTAAKTTSTGVCFIGKRDFATLVAAHAAAHAAADEDAALLREPGPIKWLWERGDAEVPTAASVACAADGRCNTASTTHATPLVGALHRHGERARQAEQRRQQRHSAPLHDGVARYVVGQRLLIRHPGHRGGTLLAVYVAARDLASRTLYVVPRWDDPTLFVRRVALTDLRGTATGSEQFSLVARHLQPPADCRVGLAETDGKDVAGAAACARQGTLLVDVPNGLRAPGEGQVGALYVTRRTAKPQQCGVRDVSACAAAGLLAVIYHVNWP